MDSVVIHLGHILYFEIEHELRSKDGIKTLLSALVFEYHSHIAAFKKYTDVSGDECVQITIPGRFKLLEVSKADCEKTGVMQPYALLGRQSNENNFEQILLLQLVDLKKLEKLFLVDCNLSGAGINFSEVSKFFICNGPSLTVIDSHHKMIYCYKMIDKTVMNLNKSFERANGAVFDFTSFNKKNTLKCKFLSLCSTSDELVKTTQSIKWIRVVVVFNFAQMQLNFQYEDNTILPNEYCISANTITPINNSGKTVIECIRT